MSKIYYPELNAFLKQAIIDYNYQIDFCEDYIYHNITITFPKAVKGRKITFSRCVCYQDKKNQYSLFVETTDFREMGYHLRLPHWWNPESINYNLVIDDALHQSINDIFKLRLFEETRKLRTQQAQHDIKVANYFR